MLSQFSNRSSELHPFLAMNYISIIIASVLLANVSADTPPVRMPTTEMEPVTATPVVLQNLPGRKRQRGGIGDNKIVGGSLAARGDFPSIALGNGCAGSLIHSDIVLTAAHCKVSAQHESF